MTTDRRPDFIIIGATKSATTWLQSRLQQHPKIFMPDPELHFFSRGYDQGEAWYQAQFADARPDQLIGEKSNSYFDEPPAETRLKAYAPDARLIAQLRNPIDRAYSDYCMLFRRAEVSSDIDRYLGADSPLKNRLLDSGLYHRHMRRYLDRFPREQLLVTLYDDMTENPAALLDRVSAHIGLAEPLPHSPAVAGKIKDKNAPMLPLGIRRLAKPIKHWVAPFRQQSWFIKTRSLLAEPVDYPPLTPALRRKLADYFQSDIEALAELLATDLDHWLLSRSQHRQSEAV